MNKKIVNNNVTVYDIANAAGVTQSTVSKALNNYKSINAETREKILRIAEELNYRPNTIARSLAMKRTRTIGLIVEDLSNPFYGESAKEILERSKTTEYSVIISDSYNDSLSNSVNRLHKQRVDGILISAVNRHETLRGNVDSDIPILFFNQCPDEGEFHKVILDDYSGATIAVNYLIEMGHRNIGFLSGNISRSTFYQRYLGYKDALMENSLKVNEDFVFIGDRFIENIKEHFSKEKLLYRNEQSFTAFFAASDAIALDMIGMLMEFGYRVPEDISVIGFGDVNIASSPLVNLTTISQNITQMAVEAFDSLVEIIDSRSEGAAEGADRFEDRKLIKVLSPCLIARKTVARIP